MQVVPEITREDFAAAPRVRPLDEVALAEQQFRDHAAEVYDVRPDDDLFALECIADLIATFIRDLGKMHDGLDIARDVATGYRIRRERFDPNVMAEAIMDTLPLSVEAATVLSARFAIAAAGAPRKVA